LFRLNTPARPAVRLAKTLGVIPSTRVNPDSKLQLLAVPLQTGSAAGILQLGALGAGLAEGVELFEADGAVFIGGLSGVGVEGGQGEDVGGRVVHGHEYLAGAHDVRHVHARAVFAAA